jgi:hypothetical protein
MDVQTGLLAVYLVFALMPSSFCQVHRQTARLDNEMPMLDKYATQEITRSTNGR